MGSFPRTTPMTRQTVAGCGWCRSRADGMRRQTFKLKVAGAICFTGAAPSKSEVKRCSKSTHQQRTFCLRAHWLQSSKTQSTTESASQEVSSDHTQPIKMPNCCIFRIGRDLCRLISVHKADLYKASEAFEKGIERDFKLILKVNIFKEPEVCWQCPGEESLFMALSDDDAEVVLVVLDFVQKGEHTVIHDEPQQEVSDALWHDQGQLSQVEKMALSESEKLTFASKLWTGSSILRCLLRHVSVL